MNTAIELLIRNRLQMLEDNLAWTEHRIEHLKNDLDEQKKLKILFDSEKQALEGELLAAGLVIKSDPVSS